MSIHVLLAVAEAVGLLPTKEIEFLFWAISFGFFIRQNIWHTRLKISVAKWLILVQLVLWWFYLKWQGTQLVPTLLYIIHSRHTAWLLLPTSCGSGSSGPRYALALKFFSILCDIDVFNFSIAASFSCTTNCGSSNENYLMHFKFSISKVLYRMYAKKAMLLNLAVGFNSKLQKAKPQ